MKKNKKSGILTLHYKLVKYENKKKSCISDPNDVRRKPYECKMCGKRFGLHNNLAKHKRTHLGIVLGSAEKKEAISEKDDPRRKRDKPVKCDVCQKILSGRDALKMHKLIHLGIIN